MDLRLFFRVLGRFRYLVAGGTVLAVLLAGFSYAEVKLDGGVPRLEPRGDETWQSTGTLFVTQQGFPWGRSVLNEVVPVGPSGSDALAPKYSDPSRFASLAILYAELAKSDDVRALMLRDGPIVGEPDAAPMRAEDGNMLPMIRIGARARTAAQAEDLAQRATDALLVYLRQLQDRENIPAGRRVQVEVIEKPAAAQLVEGRRLTRPIFLFVLLGTATLMLAFMLENLRPRRAPAYASVPASPQSLPEPVRKTA
jgi:hypothetical protein